MHTSTFGWSHVAATGFLVVGSILAVACGSAQEAPPPDPQLTQGQYCQRTGGAFCRCIGVAPEACAEAYNLACLAGKDASSMTPYTDSQTATCEAALGQKCTSVIVGQVPECPGLTFPLAGIPGLGAPQ